MSDIKLTRQESPDKPVQESALLSSLKESDFKFDTDWFKKVQEAAASELVKSGVLPTLGLIYFGVDDKPAVPAKPEAPREGGKPADLYQSGDKDRSAKLEYDKDGKPVKFTDYNQDVYERGADGSWTRGKPMFDPPQQVKLNVDADGKVTIKYPIEEDKTGSKAITRTIQKDGSEVTTYEQASSKDIVTTERKRHADGETLTVKRAGGDQVMQYDKKGDLTSVKTSDGRKYERDEKGSWSEIDKDGNRRSLDRTENDGSKRKGMVRADANGAVTVRDESQPNSDKYAHRFLPNGVVVNSDRSGASRTTTTPDGLTIKDRAHGPQPVGNGGLGSRTFEYRDKDGNVTGQISILFGKNGRQKITGQINGEELKLQKQPGLEWKGTIAGRNIQNVSAENGNDSIKFTAADGKNFFIDGTGKIREGDAHQGRKLEERSMVQEMPRDFQKQIEERLKHVDKIKDDLAKDRGWTRERLEEELQKGFITRDIPLTYKILKRVFDLAQDGGTFDDKQKGGQYQKWGNFAFGIYAKALGLSEFEALNGTAGYKRYLQGKPQDPQDYEDIKKGIAYYDRTIKARK